MGGGERSRDIGWGGMGATGLGLEMLWPNQWLLGSLGSDRTPSMAPHHLPKVTMALPGST